MDCSGIVLPPVTAREIWDVILVRKLTPLQSTFSESTFLSSAPWISKEHGFLEAYRASSVFPSRKSNLQMKESTEHWWILTFLSVSFFYSGLNTEHTKTRDFLCFLHNRQRSYSYLSDVLILQRNSEVLFELSFSLFWTRPPSNNPDLVPSDFCLSGGWHLLTKRKAMLWKRWRDPNNTGTTNKEYRFLLPDGGSRRKVWTLLR
jgi:hypothetical protein